MKHACLILTAIIIFCAGCGKPYNMLDERGKIQRTFEKYVILLDQEKYDEAYEILYFGHLPNGGNREMFRAAQKVMSSMCENIDYQPTPPVVHDNLAVMDIDYIFSHKNGHKIKNTAQVYFVKSGDTWKIVIGEYKVRKEVLKVYPEFAEKFTLKPDRSFTWNGEAWDEIKETPPSPAQE